MDQARPDLLYLSEMTAISGFRTSISMSDDSSDMVMTNDYQKFGFKGRVRYQKLSLPSSKEIHMQNKYTALDSASQTSSVLLLEILRKSSIHAKHSVQHAKAQQKELVFDAFKLAKRPTRTDARV